MSAVADSLPTWARTLHHALVLGCVTTSLLLAGTAERATAQAAAQSSGTTPLHEAVVAFVRKRVAMDVLVDSLPLPLAVDAQSTGQLNPSANVNALSDIQQIVRVGLRGFGKNVQDSCGGVLLPYEPTSTHRGCPTTPRRQVMLVLGAPRRESELPGKRDGEVRWRMRTIETNLTPGGFGCTVYEYDIIQIGTRFEVVRERGVFVVE